VAAFTITALLGASLFLLVLALYPSFFQYMKGIFSFTIPFYVVFILGEVVCVYLYRYTWDMLKDNKRLHLLIGVGLNVFGTGLLITANAWGQFMLTPGGVNEAGQLVSGWAAVNNSTWIPMIIHRIIANVAFSGFVVGAYAAYKFFGTRTKEELEHYDWMGYVGNFVGLVGLIPLPFAGYWMGIEIYRYSEQMGIQMMGGLFSWLFVIQAVLIGILFVGANYYLWIGMRRMPGGERYTRFRLPLAIILFTSFAVWLTPHTMVGSIEELRALGGTYHPVLGVFGVMSAKNTAVNLVILATFVSLILYRRANKEATVPWARQGKKVQGGLIFLAGGLVLVIGMYGYIIPAASRVMFWSPIQVATVFSTILLVTAIDLKLFKGAKDIGTFRWGDMPPRSQYTLFTMAAMAALLMGLMGYLRSAGRQDWHVYGVLRDTSPDFWTPTLGSMGVTVSIIVFAFYLLVALVFWWGLERRGDAEKSASAVNEGEEK
jgi:cytochrome bd-type quinol oxidase subunit 1